jgi:hypothetical protein
METPCDAIDKALFRARTVITLGNGEKIKFWSDNWLEGSSPKEIAPSIFRLSKRKSNCLKLDFVKNHWMTLLNPITSVAEIHELVHLGSKLQNVTLSQDISDDILWKWTENSQYFVKSAYLAQFQGGTTHAMFKPIWTSQAEPKQRFFGWLLLHQKVLTADNLLKRHWPCDWICSLCTSAFEDANHLAKECAFTLSVWNQVCQWQGHSVIPRQHSALNLADWWDMLCHSSSGTMKKPAHNLVECLA